MTTSINYTNEQLQSSINVIRMAQTAENNSGKAGDALLAMAQTCDSDEQFKEVTKLALKHWKETPANKGKATPRTFTQIKSNIMGAYKLGLNLSDYETEGALRKACKEARKALDNTKDLTIRAGIKANIAKLQTSELGDMALSVIVEQLTAMDVNDADKLVGLLAGAMEKMTAVQEKPRANARKTTTKA
ncbi:hypothetical protein NVP1034O_66 [Vibrio phage 1.034.O._10N.261.46.B7]|nr:hypothetical protein NVP1034O_66 [Vibrio phage 1.034.O._10N.261.46.B7]AUR83498.1 hypothetical protein NVP1034X_68 [Vibrio phage 1.034.X._10N.261.46.B7]